jgi:thioredoxin reductase (NADPH)
MPENSSPDVVRAVGFQWTPHAHEVRDFLARNAVPYRWLDVESTPEARSLLEEAGLGTEHLPVLFFADGSHLAAPSDAEIAERIGHHTEAASPFYDLIVVGGGPAGLAAAVYGASEGLRTLIVEREAPGGQAGQSSSIENYLGFPEGITGAELARRAVEQARRFGVEILTARRVTGVRAGEPYRYVTLDDGQALRCYVVLLAIGVSWRVLEAPGCPSLTGAGIYYGAAAAEAHAARGQDVYLLGGGNSAGQAAMLLARYARSVTMLVLEDSIEERMSKYLVERILHTPNIHVRTGHTVEEAHGEGRLQEITVRNVETEETEKVVANALFVFIGAVPETDWLEGVVARDPQGFILCGDDLAEDGGDPRRWTLERPPLRLETSLPGVFVAGDARAGSVKRVASAVGEGAIAVQFIHQYLGE